MTAILYFPVWFTSQNYRFSEPDNYPLEITRYILSFIKISFRYDLSDVDSKRRECSVALSTG